jgi:hypothetical protein
VPVSNRRVENHARNSKAYNKQRNKYLYLLCSMYVSANEFLGPVCIGLAVLGIILFQTCKQHEAVTKSRSLTWPMQIDSFVQTFSVPNDTFTHKARRALVIGINYTGLSCELNGCIHDASNAENVLRDGFKFRHILKLCDNTPAKPTKANILAALRWLVKDAKEGDTLYLHYSGHGNRTKDHTGDEENGLDETIVPLDYQEAGEISDDTLYHELVVALRGSGACLTVVADCCHSGTGLDLPINYSADESDTFVQEHGAREDQKLGVDVIFFSGCTDEQIASDTKSYGAFTDVFYRKLRERSVELNHTSHGMTYEQALLEVNSDLRRKQFAQTPRLSATIPINLGTPFRVYRDHTKKGQQNLEHC